ncbi:Gfo/Idh/MocA family protein [Cyclobacterium jeungdonense]|uniref:Gfo/Idh/MocA family oxidoreductase n=1 Tax=Cyclobacterium jeungdonense TaxID=708087 RepID=A0ABT8CAF7_9BACT|nr:Gfo/Idh/MocA family oxidoreductase [Cyclobacterium jeungdonense]MDN3689361.1 Gfo/Idh/MocA family oxidoreductase [Cyclobacterium jeungdonense]
MVTIGIIGMSAGNAHPYSWSSIINGQFDHKLMEDAGYPAVGDYLKANQDTLGIPSARVTHIWTQERRISQDIARHSGIPHVLARLEEMVGEVDAVILARDDPEHHVAMARPFLEAGIPIFIDKPLAFSREDLNYFDQQQRSGKFLMSCSSMRYAHECRTLKTEINSLGPLQLITAVGKKDWKKYGVHLVEALFSSLDDPQPQWVQHVGETNQSVVLIGFEQGMKATIHLFQDISGTFQLSFFGSKDWRLVEIKNSYAMFRDNMIEFIRSVEEGAPRLDFGKTRAIIQTVIAAQESFEKDGKVISLR